MFSGLFLTTLRVTEGWGGQIPPHQHATALLSTLPRSPWSQPHIPVLCVAWTFADCSASEMTFAGVRGHDSCRWSLDSCSSVLWEGIAFAIAAGPGEGDPGWTGWERLDTRKWRSLGEFRTSSSPQEEQVEAPGVWVQLTVGEGKEGPRRCHIDSSWGLILPYLTSSLGHRRGLWPRWTSHNMAAL